MSIPIIAGHAITPMVGHVTAPREQVMPVAPVAPRHEPLSDGLPQSQRVAPVAASGQSDGTTQQQQNQHRQAETGHDQRSGHGKMAARAHQLASHREAAERARERLNLLSADLEHAPAEQRAAMALEMEHLALEVTQRNEAVARFAQETAMIQRAEGLRQQARLQAESDKAHLGKVSF